MGKRELNPNRYRTPREEHKETVSALQAAVLRSREFLRTASNDKHRGHFTSAAQALITADAITPETLENIGVSKELFNALVEGSNIKDLGSDIRRSIIQQGSTAAKTRLFREFGVRLG